MTAWPTVSFSKKLMLTLLVLVALGCIAVLQRRLPSASRASREVRLAGKAWTWACEYGQCLRRPWDVAGPPWISLPHCRAVCGAAGPPLWPRPTGPTRYGRRATIFHLQQVVYKIRRGGDARTTLLLRDAFNVFKSNLEATVPDEELDVRLRPSEAVLKVSVFLRGVSNDFLTLNTSEAYRLRVETTDDGVVTADISAHTFFGARHGLETLSQLIWWETDENLLGAYRVLDSVSVEDAPRFPYRGIMIDVARNYIPVDALRTTIVGMAASKLNALHLHLTDSQSFPLESSTYPQMSRSGAYSSDAVYTVSDIRELSEFARVRGVRLVPEIDVPAHAGAGWTWGEKEGLGKLAVCVDRQPWQSYCGEPPCGQLNPSNNHTYTVLGELYRQLVETTRTTDLFHIGGDEVNSFCWEEEVFKNTSAFTRDVFHKMLTDFHQRALEELHKVKKVENIVVWSSSMKAEEYVATFPPTRYVIEEWGGSDWTDTVTHLRLGYRVIIAHVDAWYLDCGFGNWIPGAGEACAPVSTWQRVYSHRPWKAYKDANGVLGGEACLWSEKVDGGTLATRVWPRAAALAERLWSDVERSDIREVTERMAVQRERLQQRGVAADVVWPRWCDENPHQC